MNLYSFSLLSFSFGVLLVGILSLMKRKDYIATRFFNFSVSVCGWGFPYSFWVNQNYSENVTLWLIRIAHAFANFIPITWVHFVFAFIKKKEPTKCFYLINYVIATILTAFSPTAFYVKGLRTVLEFQYFTVPSVFFHCFTAAFFFLVPYGFIYLVKAYCEALGPERVQLKYLVIGTIVGFVAGSTFFLPTYNIPFPLYSLLAMPLYPILVGIALIKHRLFETHEIADAFQREKLAAIGTLASSLNHELRNPLFVVRGKIESHLDAIQQRFYPSVEEEGRKTNETLSSALTHLNRAMDIMQRFTAFSKPFGHKDIKETLVLGQVLRDVLGLVSNEFELKKIKLNFPPMNGLSVLGNRRQFEEIFFNLIVNACQAMGDNGGELSISAYKTDRKTCVEMSDTGPGILKEDLAKIFEPFYSTKGDKGTGLGLYITKQLVERNKGKIAARSKNGQGTTFIIEFLKENNESL